MSSWRGNKNGVRGGKSAFLGWIPGLVFFIFGISGWHIGPRRPVSFPGEEISWKPNNVPLGSSTPSHCNLINIFSSASFFTQCKNIWAGSESNSTRHEESLQTFVPFCGVLKKMQPLQLQKTFQLHFRPFAYKPTQSNTIHATEALNPGECQNSEQKQSGFFLY